VIRIVSTNCVPVAVNLYLIRADKGPGGDLFRSVSKQMDQYQGFWMASPEGKALGKYHDWKGDPAVPLAKRVVMMVEDALKAYGPVTPRDVQACDHLPHRGRGVQADGSVNVALYGRLLHQGKSDGPMMLDSVTLKSSEWARFAPPESGSKEWAIPETTARSLARSVLSPGDSAGVFRPEDFTQAELQAKVESVQGGKARISLTGTWRAAGLYGGEKGHPYGASASAEGFALFDVEKKSMDSFFLLYSGKTWGKTETPARETGGVAEWTAVTNGERSNP